MNITEIPPELIERSLFDPYVVISLVALMLAAALLIAASAVLVFFYRCKH